MSCVLKEELWQGHQPQEGSGKSKNDAKSGQPRTAKAVHFMSHHYYEDDEPPSEPSTHRVLVAECINKVLLTDATKAAGYVVLDTACQRMCAGQQWSDAHTVHKLKHWGGRQEERMTFLDTPGHEAFELSRGRTMAAADVAVVVVSVERGAELQTEEVPVVFALNKIDLPDCHLDLTRAELRRQCQLLYEHGLVDVDWTQQAEEAVPISALLKRNLEELVDRIREVASKTQLPLKRPEPLTMTPGKAQGFGAGMMTFRFKKEGLEHPKHGHVWRCYDSPSQPKQNSAVSRCGNRQWSSRQSGAETMLSRPASCPSFEVPKLEPSFSTRQLQHLRKVDGGLFSDAPKWPMETSTAPVLPSRHRCLSRSIWSNTVGCYEMFPEFSESKSSFVDHKLKKPSSLATSRSCVLGHAPMRPATNDIGTPLEVPGGMRRRISNEGRRL
eukprot:s469_g2.t1